MLRGAVRASPNHHSWQRSDALSASVSPKREKENFSFLIAFEVYKSEVARLTYEWGCRGFCKDEFEKILSEIVYLTETARERLKILLD